MRATSPPSATAPATNSSVDTPRRLIVIFGAAVRADGRASPTLARRVAYAEAAAHRYTQAHLFCSGAKGAHGPSEASVMACILARTIDPDRIHLDEASIDTLEQVRAAVRFAKHHDCDECLTCTDGYHQPRVRMLFAMLGMKTRPVRLPHAGRKRYRAKMAMREALALPYDLVAGTTVRLRRRKR
jgi:uncharacterized SAM-binding protein YcdF (DUF218 family)